MELHQIHYFLKVARTLNMTRAAEELHVSQPSLSRQIKLLEEELAVLLFERLPQGLRLTPAGGALQTHLEGLVQQLEQTHRLMEPFASGGRGQIKIGCVPSLAAHFLPLAMTDFLRAYPGTESSVHVLSTGADVFRQLHEGAIDVGICADEDPSLAQAFLFTEPLLAAVPDSTDHGEVLALQRLQELPFVATPQACSIRRKVESVTDGRLNRVLHVEQLDAALQFVAQGVGIAVAPTSLACYTVRPGVRFLPIDPPLSQSVYAFWRPGSFVDAAHPLLKFLREHGCRLSAPLASTENRLSRGSA